MLSPHGREKFLHSGLHITITSIKLVGSARHLHAQPAAFRKRIVSVTSHGPDNSSKPEEKVRAEHVDQFILVQIDTVPHLEALLLAWRRRPKTWSVDEMASQLYVPTDQSARILREL